MVKILTMDQIHEEGRWLRLMGYGQPGTGKTWFGASAAFDELTTPCLFLEYRSQIASLRSDPRIAAAIEKKDLVILRLEAYAELNHVYTFLKTGKQKQLAERFEGVMPASVVLDSVTELQRTEVLRRGGNEEGVFLAEIESPEIGGWNKLLNQFALLARLFYDPDLACHMIFLALEQVEYGRVVGPSGKPTLETKVTGFGPALQGAAQSQVPAYALTLMRLVRAAPNAKYYNVGYTRAAKTAAKEQTGAFPKKIEGPTIPALVKALAGVEDKAAKEAKEVASKT